MFPEERKRKQHRSVWFYIAVGLCGLLIVQTFVASRDLQQEANCLEGLAKEAGELSLVHTENAEEDDAMRRLADSARTVIYVVPTLVRPTDPEMWQNYGRHFVSHAAYARKHGYTYVLDTTNYVELPENRKYEEQARGNSDWVIEGNWPFALRAALNSRIRNASAFDYDWVYMIDVDIMLVHDLARPLQEWFGDDFRLFNSGPTPMDILVAQPFAHAQYGEAIAAYALFMRNNERTRWLADEWVRLISGSPEERCGAMTFGDQGYLHVALLKLILRERRRNNETWVPDQSGDNDDDCFKRCRMEDMYGAINRTGSVQPTAPHEHERYALTLRCFEFRSREMGLLRGHRSYKARGPVAFSDVSRRDILNRSLAYPYFESGVGLNANWDEQVSTEGNYQNLYDALSIHAKADLGIVSFADTRREFVGATTSMFGPVYMASIRTMFRRLLHSGVTVWRSAHVRRDAMTLPPTVDPSMPLTAPPKLGLHDSDTGEFIVPTEQLRMMKPVWMKFGTGKLDAIIMTDVPGTQSLHLAKMLAFAHSQESFPQWSGESRCGALATVSCPELAVVSTTRHGPVPTTVFQSLQFALAPQGMPMPFPNMLLEESLSVLPRGETGAPAGVTWHFLMLAHPAIRVARVWREDEEEQNKLNNMLRDRPDDRVVLSINSLRAYSQRKEHIDTQVRTVMGCVPYVDLRPCCCREGEQLYHAMTVLRHFTAFFGITDQWALSMQLLEATLRFGFGAPWMATTLDQSGPAGPWDTRSWDRPAEGLSAQNFTVSSERKPKEFRTPRAQPWDHLADPSWALLMHSEASLYHEIERRNPRDLALFEFGMQEFSRRLRFFEL